MRALVIGGAGYIGSVTAQLLKEAGHKVTIVDDLSTGHKLFAQGIDLVSINTIDDTDKLASVLKDVSPDVVLHFAAKISVAESVEKPHLYFKNNTYGTMVLLEEMVKAECKNIVFSSTAAVYGEPEKVPIDEDDLKKPINPYGLSKYLSEQILESYNQTNKINWVSFRYFNAAGAYKKSAMDYPVMTHLIPHATEAVLGNQTLKIFGNDYDTQDGTCIRDFIHVVDIAQAHVVAAEKMIGGKRICEPINLGSGSGYSVMQVIKTVEKVANKPVPFEIKPRRTGDPAVLIASPRRAQELLNWQPKLSLEDMVKSHLEWRQASAS